MIFLDSDAIIAILRGTPAMGAFLAGHQADLFAIPIPVLYEIYYGFEYPPLAKKFRNDTQFLQRLQAEQQRMQQLLNDIQVFDLNLAAIKKSAAISAKLDAEGTLIGKFDMLIAGVILGAGYNQIVTSNSQHYDKIKELEVLTF
jgi:tRNA(fMet)-specific endonuclease VapC